MRKALSFILILTLVLGLCACGSSGESESSQLLVGYSRENILPSDSVPLAGYGQTQNRMSTQYIDYLYATCVAFTEGDETVLIFALDQIRCSPAWTSAARDAISQETGVPMDHIFMSASHTHSGPDVGSSDPAIKTYQGKWVRCLTKAAKNAIADQAPATLYGTKTETENLNFVREYILDDGRKGAGATFVASGTPVAHLEEGDPEMVLVKAEREGDKKDILLMNWQAHPCTTGSMKSLDLSADFIASVRDEIEFTHDMHFIYFTGAAGNQNTDSEIPGEKSAAVSSGEATKEALGKALAEVATAALPNLQPIEGSGVRSTQIRFEYAYNHADEDKVLVARQAVDIWKAEGHAAADKFAVENGMHTIYHASSIVNRISRPATGDMELDAVRIGGMGFAFAPYEMYASSGRYIKDNSPYAFTMVLSCANEAHGYFATMESYDVGTYGSTTASFARGCAEASAEKLVELLKSVQ